MFGSPLPSLISFNNVKKERGREKSIENKLEVTSEERERKRGIIGVGIEEVQAIRYKIDYKNILYDMENRANVL